MYCIHLSWRQVARLMANEMTSAQSIEWYSVNTIHSTSQFSNKSDRFIEWFIGLCDLFASKMKRTDTIYQNHITRHLHLMRDDILDSIRSIFNAFEFV